METLNHSQSEFLSDKCGDISNENTAAAARFLHIIITRMSTKTPLTTEDVSEILCYNFKSIDHPNVHSFFNNIIGKIPTPCSLLCQISVGYEANFMLVYSYFKNSEHKQWMFDTQVNPLTWVKCSKRYEMLRELGFELDQELFNSFMQGSMEIFGCDEHTDDEQFIELLQLIHTNYPNLKISDTLKAKYVKWLVYDENDTVYKINCNNLQKLIESY